ncbi:MAG: hypothetical protein V9E83_01565 [Baekduia sp.]
MSGLKRLYDPVPARVRVAPDGRPLAVDGHAVDAIRESWLVEDRWWTGRPLRRRYWELVTDRGELVVVFRDLLTSPARPRWFRQRGR